MAQLQALPSAANEGQNQNEVALGRSNTTFGIDVSKIKEWFQRLLAHLLLRHLHQSLSTSILNALNQVSGRRDQAGYIEKGKSGSLESRKP